MQLRYYMDNGIPVSVAITDPQPKVEAVMKAIDATDQDRMLVEKLMAMDAGWSGLDREYTGQWVVPQIPNDQADRIHELERDADLEIKRQRDRTSQMAICAAIGWCVAVWVSVLWWLS